MFAQGSDVNLEIRRVSFYFKCYVFEIINDKKGYTLSYSKENLEKLYDSKNKIRKEMRLSDKEIDAILRFCEENIREMDKIEVDRDSHPSDWGDIGAMSYRATIER